MTYQLDRMPGERDALCVEIADRDRVRAALEAELKDLGFAKVEPAELPLLGRWFHGEEAPHVRRFLLAPPTGRWTVVVPSGRDWDGDLAAGLARRLDCRCVQLMLHDSDVLTLDVVDATGSASRHVSSPVHFDLPPRSEGDHGFDVARLLPACEGSVTTAEVVAALTPPGATDIDGNRSFDLVLDLLGLPSSAKSSYRLALEDDGRTLVPDFQSHEHLGFRGVAPPDSPSPDEGGDDGRDAESHEGEDGGRLLRFPRTP